MTHELENSYTKRFLHCCKSSSKGTETPREFDFEGQWDLTTELPQDWGNRLLEGTNKTCMHQEKGAVSPQETESDLPVSVQ